MRNLLERTRSGKLAAVLLPAMALAGCPGEAPVEIACGAGTELKSGICVAIGAPEDACGDGTVFNEETGDCETTVVCGEGTELDPESLNCVPIAECGPGTELDLTSGNCVPVASCGEGTVFDAETGTCVSEASCGIGTELVDGACVALDVCAPGSVRNMDTGLCESDTACGPGQVIVNGQCMNPNQAVGLEADAVESTPDRNDPLYEGTPEPLVLEPLGEETVFVGNIGRPADFGGTGTETQDRDAWSFEGTAGQLLSIEVLGTGLPQPAFVVEGPRGYVRSSALLSTNSAQREVVLPYDGTYTVTVMPTAWVSTGLPVGGNNAGYVGVIEEIEKPEPTLVVPSTDQTVPTEIEGNLRGLLDNFLRVDAPVGAAVSLIFHDADEGTPPAVLAYDAAGNLITHVDLVLEQGNWVGTLVKDEEGTTVVVDWQSSTSLDDAYTLLVAEVPHIQGGTVVADIPGATDGTTIPSSGMAAYTLTLPSALVLNTSTEGSSSPDLQLLDEQGSYGVVYDKTDFFFFGQPGTYTVFVYNDAGGDDTNAHLAYLASTPYDLGTHDPANPQLTEVSGPFLTPDILGPDLVWGIVSITGPGVFEFVPAAKIGEPTLSVYDVAGNVLHGYWRASAEQPLYYVADGPETLLVLLDSDGYSTLEWSLKATSHPLAPIVDIEPNDAAGAAIDLGAVPAMGLGTIDDSQSDFYRLTLDEPIGPGQHLEVNVDILDGNGIVSFTTGSVKVLFYDELEQPIDTSPGYFGDHNVSHAIPAHVVAGSTSIIVEIVDEFIDSETPYLIHARVVDGLTEVEPNNTAAEATMAPSLPAAFRFYSNTADVDADPRGPDYFGFTLEEPLQAGEVLYIRMLNMVSHNDTTMYLELADGTVLTSSFNNWDATLVVPGLPAGTYYVRHAPHSLELPYRLTIEKRQLPIEMEPNDAAEQATAIGTLAPGGTVTGFGLTDNADPDWFTFSLDAPVPAGEAVVVRVMNIQQDDSSTFDVELWDLSDPESPVRLGSMTDDEGALVGASGSTGPFGVRVEGNASSTDMYHFRVETRAIPAEREPNDSVEAPQDLGVLASGGSFYVQGSTSTSDDDTFAFTLDPGVDPGAGIWVSFDNLTDSTDIDVYLLDITDPANPVQLSYEDDDFGTLVSAQAGGTYAVRIEGTSSTPDSYELTIRTGEAAELEPNDDSATAMDLALPASLYGVISNTTADLFTFTLDADLSETQVVRVAFTNLDDGSSYDVTLRRADGTELLTADDDAMVLDSEPGLLAGDYEIQIDGFDSTSSSSARVSDLYRLEVSVVELPPITP